MAAFVTVALAIAAVAASAGDPTLVGFGVGGLFVGACFGLGLRLDPLFRVLPGWFVALALTVTVGLTWAMLAPSGASAAWVVLPTLALFVTGLDWSRAARLRTVALLSGLLAVPVVATPNVAALLLGLGWFLGALVTCWAALGDLRAALPRPRPARPTTSPELAPSTPGELVRLASLAAMGALALALLIGSPSCDPQSNRDLTGQSGSRGGSSGGAGSAGGQSGSAGGQSGSGRVGGSGQAGGGSGRGGAGGGSGQAGSGSGGSSSSGSNGGASGGGTSAGGSTSGGTTSGSSGTGSASSADSSSSLTAILAGLLLVAALVGIALVLWPRRRRPDHADADGPPPWARTLVARLDAEGAARGRPRGRGETVVEHAAALAEGPLPDPRIAELGWLLSAALFSGREPPEDRRIWAEAVLAEVTAAHPVPEPAPRTSGRRRGQPDGSPA